MNIIEFKNIYVSYGDKEVLKDINLTINEGEHYAILGSNGSGKSTLMKLIQSEIHPILKYKPVKKIFESEHNSIFELRDKLGIITNDLHNFIYTNCSYLNGLETVLSGLFSSVGIFSHQKVKKSDYAKANEVMSFLDIEHLKDKKVSTMSTGELRRCVVARALIHSPKAFILDEPTVGLDIKAQISFLKTIKKLSGTATIILVTHHLEEIFEGIENIVLLHQNTIYKKGKIKDTLTNENLSKIFDIELKIENENGRYFIKSVK